MGFTNDVVYNSDIESKQEVTASVVDEHNQQRPSYRTTNMLYTANRH